MYKYENKKYTGTDTLPNRDMIDDLEKKVGSKLPDEYADFLLMCNGGKPDDCMSGDIVVRQFFSISDEFARSLEYHHKIYTLAGRMPSHIVPIANDNGSNCLCISLGDQDFGAVYFWDHDGEDPGYENLSLINDSFSGFLESLGPEEYDF